MASRLPSPSTSTAAIGSSSEAAESVKVRPSRPREGVPPTIRQSASVHSVRSWSAGRVAKKPPIRPLAKEVGTAVTVRASASPTGSRPGLRLYATWTRHEPQTETR